MPPPPSVAPTPEARTQPQAAHTPTAVWAVDGQAVRAAVWLAVGVGIALRLAAYLANRPIFIDEAALALSVRDRTPAELLTRPLDYGQTAPPGFLLLLEAATAAFGESEHSLRLPALLAGIISVPLFAVLARRVLTPAGALVSVSLFAVGRPLVYYSGEAKPYALDVLAALVVLLLALPLATGQATNGRARALGIAGAGLAWLSQPVLLVMAGVGAGLLATLPKNRATVRSLAWRTALPWTVSGILAVWHAFAVYPRDARAYMRAYWGDGFLPAPPRSLEEWLWLPRAFLTFCLDPLGSPVPVLPLSLMLAGVLVLARRDRRLLALVGAPFVVAVTASAVKAYPFGRLDFDIGMFSGRVVLFLLPAALLLVGSGFGEWWSGCAGKWRRAAYVTALTMVGSSAALTVVSFPFHREDARVAFEYLARHRAPGEPVYVYYRAQHYARFYAPRFGLDAEHLDYGTCLHEPPAAYLRELDDLRAKGRMWFVVVPAEAQEPRAMHEFLRLNAMELKHFQSKRARVSLVQMRAGGRAILPPDSMLVARGDPVVKRLACATIYRRPPR